MSPVFACGRHAELAARVESLELRPDPGLLLPELVRFRTSAEEAKAAAVSAKEIATEVFDEVGRLRVEVNRLAEWRDDSKIHEIAELRRALEEKTRADILSDALKAERASIADINVESRREVRDERGDRRKFRYAFALAILGAILGAVGGRASVHPQCSHAAVGP